MKNKKIYICLLLILFSFMFFKTNTEVFGLENGIVEDTDEVGLWHEIEIIENYYRAYVKMRVFGKGVPNSSGGYDHGEWTYQTQDYWGVKEDDPIWFNLNQPGYFDTEPNITSNFKSSRIISKPNNHDYETLNIDLLDDSTKEISKGYVGNVDEIKIEYVYLLNNDIDEYEIHFYDNKTDNLIYSIKRSAHNLGKPFSVYWLGEELPEPSIENSINVGENYSLLPFVAWFSQVEKVEVLSLSNNMYRFYILPNVEYYSFDLKLADEIKLEDYKLHDEKYNISYSSSQVNEKYIYMQADKSKDPYPFEKGYLYESSDSNFIIIDLVNKDDKGNLIYHQMLTAKIASIISKESNRNAYMYTFMPFEIDDLINITVKFNYQYIYFGFNGSVQTEKRFYCHEESSNVKLPWWLNIVVLGPVGSFYGNLFMDDINNISKVLTSDLPGDIRDRYSNLEISKEFQINEIEKYKIHLGQFNTFGSTNYNIGMHKDYEIIEITYLYKGIIYNTEDIIDDDKDVPEIKNPFYQLDFNGFFNFKGVKSLGDLFAHGLKYWKESIVVFVVGLVFIYMISLIIKVVQLRKKWKL